MAKRGRGTRGWADLVRAAAAPLSELEEKILRMRYGLSDGDSARLTAPARTDAHTRKTLLYLEQALRDAAGRVPGLPFRARAPRRKPRS